MMLLTGAGVLRSNGRRERFVVASALSQSARLHLRQSRRHERMNGSRPCDPSVDERTSSGSGNAVRTASATFPPTPALSLEERVNRSLRGERSRPVGFPLRDARCSLSLRALRERVRVRGNGAAYPPL